MNRGLSPVRGTTVQSLILRSKVRVRYRHSGEHFPALKSAFLCRLHLQLDSTATLSLLKSQLLIMLLLSSHAGTILLLNIQRHFEVLNV